MAPKRPPPPIAERYGTTEEALDAIDGRVEEEITATVDAAKEAPFPDPEASVTEFKS